MKATMSQSAPFPRELEHVVSRLEYRPNWTVELKDIVRDESPPASGLTLIVTTAGYNAYHPERGQGYGVCHYFPVPAATYNEQSWARWVLDRLIAVETHEACEFFRLRRLERDEDGEAVEYARPFAPNHGPGWDPYGVRELNTVEAAETTFRGVRREGTQR